MPRYVKYDEVGNEVDSKEVGRGRPPKGYVKVDDDGNEISSTRQVKQRKGCFLVDSQGHPILDSYKVAKKGHTPKGYVRIPIDKDNQPIIDVPGEPDLQVSNTEPDINTEVSPFDPEPQLAISTVEPDSMVVQAGGALDYREFVDAIDASQTTQDDDAVTLMACNVIGTIEALSEYLPKGAVAARIDVVTGTGHIKVWNNRTKGEADLTIENGIVIDSID